MQRYFNVAGPCVPGEHYMLPAQERCQGLLDLIAQNQYFVIHAARQSGKTTLLKDLTRQINDEGAYDALYCSLESISKVPEQEQGLPAIVKKLKAQIKRHPVLRQTPFAEQADYSDFTNILFESLANFCEHLVKPLVILFDEIDCLSNGTLIGFLRQLRDGYVNRPEIPFVHAIGLVGMRNIRDYKGKIREDRETLGSASPFNIVTESLTLRNFTSAEIARLYAQHTDATGQAFPADAVARVFFYTQGQPWLVNAIARDIVEKQLAHDASRPIQAAHVDEAVERLIRARPTHLDSLMERLREERVRRIIEPIIIGAEQGYDALNDDYQYIQDLGLIREVDQRPMPANPIYAEVMIRTLSARSQMEFAQQTPPVAAPAYLVNGQLDMRRLLTEFQQFWREHSAIWIEKYAYKEAAPHLILHAFLQRVINGGGRISREMAAGTRRLDLCVEYQGQRYPIEVKLRYSDAAYRDGAAQLANYAATLGSAAGWLIVFDRRPDVPWDEKLFWRAETVENVTIHTVGC